MALVEGITDKNKIVRCTDCGDTHPYGDRVRIMKGFNPFQECPKCGHTIYAEPISDEVSEL